ncbi:MAG: Crp/Fnr family transcriptional regulator [Bacteroidia bacterium]|nr:Crp/Fnr family transcriptional regulator [Bacteroidia bacterium]
MLNAFLEPHFPDPADRQRVMGAFVRQAYPRGAHLLEAGAVCSRLVFVESGVLQFYTVPDSGEARTTYVCGAGSFAVSLASFFGETPARESIRAISPASVLELDKQGLRALTDGLPAFRTFYTYLLEWQICCIDESRLQLLTLSAEARYARLLREEPHLLREIPLQYLASVLGVTPRHLSRIRNQIR